MNEQNFESLRRLVLFAARHSQEFRCTGYSSRNLSADAIEDIGFQLTHLYERLYEKHVGGNGGGPPPQTGAASGDQKQRQSDGYLPYR